MVRVFKIHVKVLKIHHRTHPRGRLDVRFTTALKFAACDAA